MALDWTPIVQFAKDMLATYGRGVTVGQYAKGPADSNRRWAGAGAPTVLSTVSANACFVPPIRDEFGRSIATDDMLARVDEIALIGQTNPDIEKYNFILDDGVKYSVDWAWTLKPGSAILLYAFGVCR